MQDPRITGGRARGIRLKVPSKSTRPATDSLRQSVFSHIGPLIDGAQVIDLFAGTGAYGLESLSRGARSLIAIDNSSRAGSCLKENYARLCKSVAQRPPFRFIKANMLSWRVGKTQRADIVFADPPYDFYKSDAKKILAASLSCLKSEISALLILEHPGDFSDFTIPEGFQLKRTLGAKKGHSPAASIFCKLP